MPRTVALPLRACTGIVMKSRIAAPLLIAIAALAPTAALAEKLPAIKASAKNAVPACATPGRMLSLLKARNPQPRCPLRDDRHASTCATARSWASGGTIAFYQMIVETGALTYRNGNKPGDVKPAQNNFAGLGATGKGERGEAFKDISSGVRAHLQHLLMYAGERVERPGRRTHAQGAGMGRADLLAQQVQGSDHLHRHGAAMGARQPRLFRHARCRRRSVQGRFLQGKPIRAPNWCRKPAPQTSTA